MDGFVRCCASGPVYLTSSLFASAHFRDACDTADLAVSSTIQRLKHNQARRNDNCDPVGSEVSPQWTQMHSQQQEQNFSQHTGATQNT